MYKYKSFISYSRAADTRLAPEIKAALQGFAKPWYKLRAIQVFCDQTNLTANPDLWTSIEKNLALSEYFIYLASPQAAQSKWVRKEIDFFHRQAGVDKMIIVLTDGNIVWDDATKDFNWRLTDAVPKFDKEMYQQEPVWIDVKWIRKEQLSTRDPRFLDAIANLSAILRNVDKDTLIGKDVEEHRKAKRFRLFSMTGLSLLALFLVIATFFAVQSEKRSQQRLIKTFNNNGIGLLERGDYAMALPWFIETWANERSNEKKETDAYRVENLFNGVPALVQVWQPELPVLSTTFLTGKNILIVSGNKENWWTNEYECFQKNGNCKAELKVMNAETGSEIFKPVIINDGIRKSVVSSDKTLFASLSIENILRLWSLEDGTLVWEQPLNIPVTKDAFYYRLDFNKQSNRLLFILEDNMHVYETGKGTVINTYKGNGTTIGSAAFLEDGNTVIFLEDDLQTWDINSKTAQRKPVPYFDYISAFKLSPDYTHMIIAGSKTNKHFKGFGSSDFQRIAYVNMQDMQEALFTKDEDNRTGSLKMEFDAHGNVLGINSSYTTEGGSADDGTRVWNVLNGNPLSGWIKFPQEVEISFDSSGKKIAITCRDGTTEIWSVADPDGSDASKRLWLLHDGNETVKSIFSPDNRYLLTSSAQGLVKLWKIPEDDFIPWALYDDIQEQEYYDTSLQWNAGYGQLDEKDTSFVDSSLAFIYNAKTFEKAGKPLQHNSEVYLAVISDVANYVATAALKEACVWKRETQQKIYNFSFGDNVAIQDISFSNDNKKILTSFSDYTARVWDAATGKPLTPYIKHPFSSSYVDQSNARFSNDGKKVITSDNDTYWIWDAGTGEPLSAPLKVYFLTGDDKLDSAIRKKRMEKSGANTFSIRSLSVNDARTYSTLIAGQQLDANSSFIPLPASDYMNKWLEWKTAKKKHGL